MSFVSRVSKHGNAVDAYEDPPSVKVVGGLVPHCTEEELYQFFSERFHGFEKMKFMPAAGPATPWPNCSHI